MPKLRKMLGDADAPYIVSLMGLIETQSKATIAKWCLDYAQAHILPTPWASPFTARPPSPTTGWGRRSALRSTMLTLAALDMAIRREKPDSGLIFHSDCGIQYAAAAYRERLAQLGIRQSMSRKGDPVFARQFSKTAAA